MRSDLKEGEVVKVQTGLVVGFEKTVSYDIALAGGITTALFGGEGLFVTTLTGPGKVVLQSMDIARIAATIIPLPAQYRNRKGNNLFSFFTRPSEFREQGCSLVLRFLFRAPGLDDEGNRIF